MKFLSLSLVWLMFPLIIVGYHHQFKMIESAENLEFRQVVVGIEHRFLGKPFKNKGLFGQNQGANVGFSARAGLGRQKVIKLSSSQQYEQKSLEYKVFRKFRPGNYIGITASFDQLNFGAKAENAASGTLFYSYQREERFDIAANIKYSHYFSEIQTGLGSSVYISSKIALFYEWLSPISAYKPNAIHMLGFKVMTFGHNFYLYASNQAEVGTIPAESGTDNDTYYIGFLIERIFDI